MERRDKDAPEIFWGSGHDKIRGFRVYYYLVVALDMFWMTYIHHEDGPVYSWENDKESVREYTAAVRRELRELPVESRTAENEFEFSKLESALNFFTENKKEDFPEGMVDEQFIILAEYLGLPPYGNLGQEE